MLITKNPHFGRSHKLRVAGRRKPTSQRRAFEGMVSFSTLTEDEIDGALSPLEVKSLDEYFQKL